MRSEIFSLGLAAHGSPGAEEALEERVGVRVEHSFSEDGGERGRRGCDLVTTHTLEEYVREYCPEEARPEPRRGKRGAGAGVSASEADAINADVPDPRVVRFLLARERDRARASEVLPVEWGRVFRQEESASGETVCMGDRLMAHQRAAIDRIVRDYDGRCLVGFEQGTGKTAVGCGVAAHYGSPALFVVPGGKLDDWQEEFFQWTGRRMRLIRKGTDTIEERACTRTCEASRKRSKRSGAGSDERRYHSEDEEGYEKEKVEVEGSAKEGRTGGCDEGIFVGVSFDLARRHKEILESVAWRTVVVDEAHKLKNASTLRAQRLIPLLHRARSVVLLTGTPEESRPSELFAPLNALYPGTFPCRTTFTKRYCEGHVNAWGEWVDVGAKHLEELRIVLSRCMIRYRKEDVLRDLPPKIRSLVRVRMRDMETVERFRKEQQRASELRAEENRACDPQLKRRIQMQRKTKSTLLWRMSEDVKVQEAKTWFVREILIHPARTEEKVIVFCVHLHNIDQVCTYIEECNVKYVKVTGKTTPAKRMKVLRPFLDDPEVRVAVLSIDSCAEALNLAVASRVVFFGMARKPGAMEQAEDRAHRKGATKPVHTYWLYAEDTHDQHVLKQNIRKATVNYAVLDHRAGGPNERAGVFDYETAFRAYFHADTDAYMDEAKGREGAYV